MTFIYATPETVARAWAQQVPGIPAAGEKLPADNTTWAASGFVVVAPAGGYSNIYYRFGHHVATFQGWANNPTSSTPPWWKARNLLHVLENETLQHQSRLVVIPDCSQNAIVKQAQCVGAPRKVFADLGDWAAYTADIQLHWVPVDK